MNIRRILIILSLLTLCNIGGISTTTAATTPAGNSSIVANSDSLWHIRTVWETEAIIKKDGKVDHVKVLCDRNFFKENKKATF